MTTTPEHDERIAKLKIASIYPFYRDKIEKKGRTVEELNEVITWLTGYSTEQIKDFVASEATFRDFFATAQINENAEMIKGLICGYRIENITTPLTKQCRYLDKVVDELARGRKLEKIMRTS